MRKNSITAEIRNILNDLKVEPKYTTVFSDTYGEDKVGVKFVDVFLDPKQKSLVKRRMKKKGFIHHYISDNRISDNFKGTRFVFSYQ